MLAIGSGSVLNSRTLPHIFWGHICAGSSLGFHATAFPRAQSKRSLNVVGRANSAFADLPVSPRLQESDVANY